MKESSMESKLARLVLIVATMGCFGAATAWTVGEAVDNHTYLAVQHIEGDQWEHITIDCHANVWGRSICETDRNVVTVEPIPVVTPEACNKMEDEKPSRLVEAGVKAARIWEIINPSQGE